MLCRRQHEIGDVRDHAQGRGRRLVVVVLGPDHAHALLRVEVVRMAVVVAAGGLRSDVTDLDHVPRRPGSGGHDQGQGHDRLRKADAVAAHGHGLDRVRGHHGAGSNPGG